MLFRSDDVDLSLDSVSKLFLDPEAAKAIAESGFLKLDAEARGFQVVRISDGENAQVSFDGDLSGGDERLFVFHGINHASGLSEFVIPQDAFAHTDRNTVVRLEVQLADGGSLPGWLSFDALTGTFRGVAPDGRAVLDVLVTARDEDGLEASIRFKLELGVSVPGEAGKFVMDGGVEIGRAHV